MAWLAVAIMRALAVWVDRPSLERQYVIFGIGEPGLAVVMLL